MPIGAAICDRVVGVTALELLDSWPVPNAAAAVVSPAGVLATRGPVDRAFRLAAGRVLVVPNVIDGEDFDQASSVCHYVREETSRGAYGLRQLIPGYDHQIPDYLKFDKHD